MSKIKDALYDTETDRFTLSFIGGGLKRTVNWFEAYQLVRYRGVHPWIMEKHLKNKTYNLSDDKEGKKVANRIDIKVKMLDGEDPIYVIQQIRRKLVGLMESNKDFGELFESVSKWKSIDPKAGQVKIPIKVKKARKMICDIDIWEGVENTLRDLLLEIEGIDDVEAISPEWIKE